MVIPTFNRSLLLMRALESVFAQTCGDYEIIVVDDGSTDDTAERLKPYLDRIRYVYQPNKGASGAQNRGIALARGDWIAILASDDTWLPRYLEAQAEAIDQFGSQIGACFSDCRLVGETNCVASVFRRAGLETQARVELLEDPLTFVLARHASLFVQGAVIRRALLSGDHLFDTRLVVAEDTDLLFRLALATKFCVIDEVLIEVDVSPSRADRLSRKFQRPTQTMFQSRSIAHDKWLAYLNEGDRSLERQRVVDLQESNLQEWLIHNIKHGRIPGFVSVIKEMTARGYSLKTVATAVFSRALGRIRKALGIAQPGRA